MSYTDICEKYEPIIKQIFYPDYPDLFHLDTDERVYLRADIALVSGETLILVTDEGFYLAAIGDTPTVYKFANTWEEVLSHRWVKKDIESGKCEYVTEELT